MLRGGKISTVGFCTGAIAGLATVTPTAGYVTPQAAMVIGIVAALACYAAVQYKAKKGWDDALDVRGVHGIGGYTGILLLGIFGTSAVLGSNGLLYGNPAFFGNQFVAGSFAAIYSFIVTYAILWIIERFTQLRTTEAE